MWPAQPLDVTRHDGRNHRDRVRQARDLTPKRTAGEQVQ